MRNATADRDHGVVSPQPAYAPPGAGSPAAPTLYRRPDRGLIGGVARGIGEHLHLKPRWVRFGFFLLAFAGGLGIALYGAYWIVLPTAPDAGKPRFPPWLEYLVSGLAVAGALVAGLTQSSV